MALTPEQRKVLAHIVRIGRQQGASPKELKAAIETGLVESNLRNLPGGSDDSAGWRQERASIYKDPTNLDASIRRFFGETHAVKGQYGTAGALAAAVQRPRAEYRGRYQQRSGEAQSLLGSGGATSYVPPGAKTTTTRTVGAVDNSKARKQLALSFLLGSPGPGGQQNTSDPVALALSAQQLKDRPGHLETTTYAPPGQTSSAAGTARPAGKGVADFEGKKVAAWIAPVLAYARTQGWKGTVQSGYRSFADQTRIYNSGVRPAAKPGTSNHEGTDFPRGAVDVSDAAQLSAIIRRSKYAHLLQWAGAKDPVHFSHPHNGSY